MASLTVRGRIHLSSDDTISASKLVACPEDRTWVPVEGCRKCARCTSADDASVTCDHPAAAPTEREHAPITEVMDENVLTVEAGALAVILRRIPVLSAGRVVGMVTPAAVLRWITRDQERSARATGTEGDRHG